VAPHEGRLVSTTAVASSALQDVYVTPEGGFQVWLTPVLPVTGTNVGQLTLQVRHIASGAVSSVPLGYSSQRLVGNPTRAEIYLSDLAGPYALSPGGVRRFAAPPCSTPVPRAVSANGSRVVYVCESFVNMATIVTDTIVFDTSNGTIVGQFQGGARDPAIDPVGSAVFYVRFNAGADTLYRWDVASGALRQAPLQGLSSRPFADPRTGRVVTVSFDRFQQFDAATLLPILSRSVLNVSFSPYYSWLFDADRPWMYGVSLSGAPSTPQTTFNIVDTDTLTVVGAGPLPGTGYLADLAMAAVPRPPTALASTVQGRAVALTWSSGGAAGTTLRYVLEVGSAPGLADIFSGLDVGLNTTFGAGGVPPGRYFVRVRAANLTGTSAPSNEVVVLVP